MASDVGNSRRACCAAGAVLVGALGVGISRADLHRAIALLVGFSKAWEQKLTPIFGAAGRLALTNYLVMWILVGLLGLYPYGTYPYEFGMVKLTPQYGVVIGATLFGMLVVFSRWWLARFRIGPAEWFLRSLTYARIQPLRRPAVAQ